jgi:hypothetical protein
VIDPKLEKIICKAIEYYFSGMAINKAIEKALKESKGED